MTSNNTQNRRGIVLVLAAACLIMILAFAAFTVDVGYILVTKAQLQSTTDAAALAGTQELATNSEGGRDAVIAAIQAVIDASDVAEGTLNFVPDEDLQIGTWNDETFTFEAIDGDDISDIVCLLASRVKECSQLLGAIR